MTLCLLNFLEGHSRAEQPYMRKIADLLLIEKMVHEVYLYS